MQRCPGGNTILYDSTVLIFQRISPGFVPRKPRSLGTLRGIFIVLIVLADPCPVSRPQLPVTLILSPNTRNLENGDSFACITIASFLAVLVLLLELRLR